MIINCYIFIFNYENVPRIEILDQIESNRLWDTIFEMRLTVSFKLKLIDLI